MRCGAPIKQEGREFYVTRTHLTRPGSPDNTLIQSDFVDASVVPYVSMPGQLRLPGDLRWEVGDLAVMIWNGKTAYAVVGDTGPADKIGEASRAALVALGRSGGAAIDEADPATTLIFPGTRALIMTQWPLDPVRIRTEGEKVVASFPGGAAALAQCAGLAGLK